MGFFDDILSGLGITGEGGLLGDITGSNAARAAAREQAAGMDALGRAQLQTAREGMGLQERLANQARQDIAPLRQRQMSALDSYMQLLAGGGKDSDLRRLEQEQSDALMARNAKLGMLGSGATTRSLADLGARIGEAREQRRFDRLGAVFGALPSTTGQFAGISSGLGSSLSNTLQQGYGNYASLYGQALQTRAQGQMAGAGDLMQLAQLALMGKMALR